MGNNLVGLINFKISQKKYFKSLYKKISKIYQNIFPKSLNSTHNPPQVLDILAAHYKPTINSKGFKVLPAYIRVIQGDGVSFESLDMLLKGLMDEGWSSENLVFGSGGALLQRLDRDTLKCAFKCSYAEVEGRPVSGGFWDLGVVYRRYFFW